MKFEGKVAIVTGAGRGIGKAIALLLARNGAKVVVNEVDTEPMLEVTNQINNQGGTALAFRANVANRGEVQKLVSATLDKFAGIHILVNNAAIRRSATILEMTEEDWDAVLDVDLKGVFNCIQAVAKQMIQQRYGKIISISSIDGMGANNVGKANYASAKAGVIGLTTVAARELGPFGINVNAIAPGDIFSDTEYRRRSKEEAERFYEESKGRCVLGRYGLPEDIANLVAFLASDEASFITGQTIISDGGKPERL